MLTATPSRASSTACARRSWWGANRRRDAGVDGELAQFGAGGGGGPAAATGGAVDDTEQRSRRQLGPVDAPGVELLEAEPVHAGLAALVALAMADQQRAAALIHVGLVERQRSRDPQPAAPQDRDQRSDPQPVANRGRPGASRK